MKLYVILAVMVLLTVVLAEDCPFSGYVRGSESVLVGGNSTHDVIGGKLMKVWYEIDDGGCWGVCPDDVVAINDAWVEINTTAIWTLQDGVWSAEDVEEVDYLDVLYDVLRLFSPIDGFVY